MKKVLHHSLFALLFIMSASQAWAFRAYFDYRVFHIPGEGPYIEFVTSFDGSTFKLAKTKGDDFQSNVELTLIVSQGDQVLDFRKTLVDGPLVPIDEPGDFMSLERFSLPNGRYNIEIEIKDLNDPDIPAEKGIQAVVIENLNEGAFISDIEFVSAYTPTSEHNAFSKSGYDILPYMSSYFPTQFDAIIFYAELYNINNYLGENEHFAFYYAVQDLKGKEIESAGKIKRLQAKSVLPQLQVVDISKVPSGDYNLVLEVRDKQNNVICSKKRSFSRSLIVAADPMNELVSLEVLNASFASKYKNRDSLVYIIQTHFPIAKSQERNTIDNVVPNAELVELQSFFYSFWYKRNPENPEAAWLEYAQQVNDVNAAFSTRIKKGWQTERGRVYLQYGPPNTRVQRPNDPDYWPFEIWHYYETRDNLHDRRFLFVNTTLGQDYELLHSDVPQEAKNYDWKQLVRSRSMNTTANVSRNSNLQNRDPYSGDELEDLWYNPH